MKMTEEKLANNLEAEWRAWPKYAIHVFESPISNMLAMAGNQICPADLWVFIWRREIRKMLPHLAILRRLKRNWAAWNWWEQKSLGEQTQISVETDYKDNAGETLGESVRNDRRRSSWYEWEWWWMSSATHWNQCFQRGLEGNYLLIHGSVLKLLPLGSVTIIEEQ